jgi:hypothetical protein
MSFNICRGTLGSLAIFTAKRNGSSRVSLFILERPASPTRCSIEHGRRNIDTLRYQFRRWSARLE